MFNTNSNNFNFNPNNKDNMSLKPCLKNDENKIDKNKKYIKINIHKEALKNENIIYHNKKKCFQLTFLFNKQINSAEDEENYEKFKMILFENNKIFSDVNVTNKPGITNYKLSNISHIYYKLE